MNLFRSARTPMLVSIVVLLAVLAGCSMDSAFLTPESLLVRSASTFVFSDPNEPSGTVGEVSVALVAGQNTDVGTVTVRVVGDSLEVTQAVDDGWAITEAHVWVGTDPAGIPTNGGGNPEPGRFPYRAENLDHVASHTFVIPLGEFYGGNLADRTLYIPGG